MAWLNASRRLKCEKPARKLEAECTYPDERHDVRSEAHDDECNSYRMHARMRKARLHYVLVRGDKVYTLKGDTKQIDKYAGQTVTVTGDVSRTTVTVHWIAPAKS
jgi:hypothetical protein